MRRAALWVVLLVACGSPVREPAPAPLSSPPPPTPVESARESGGTVSGRIGFPNADVSFADVPHGRAVLGRSDAFSQATSAFDRGLRLETTEPVSEEAFVAHAAAQVVAWSDERKRRWQGAVIDVGRALFGLELALPATVLIVATTGREELGAFHTRQNAIVIPGPAGEKIKDPLKLLAHELFHVASRHDPKLRDRLFPILGYQAIGPVTLPPELEERRITNPDAYEHRHAIELEAEGRKFLALPVLLSSKPLDEAMRLGLVRSIEITLLEVKPDGTVAVGRDGKAMRHRLEATNYLERASPNTDYALHPEEVMADNFALMISRRAGNVVDAKRPEVLEAIEKALAKR
jgi:hypothetical protein